MGNNLSLRSVTHAADCGNICEPPEDKQTQGVAPVYQIRSVRMAQGEDELMQSLARAAVQNDADAIDRICGDEGGKSVINNRSEVSGMAPLHIAAQAGSEAAFIALLRNGANLELRSKVGKRCDDYALMYSRRSIMKVIIQFRSPARSTMFAMKPTPHSPSFAESSQSLPTSARGNLLSNPKSILKGGADHASIPVPQSTEPAPAQPAGGRQDEFYAADLNDIDFMDIPVAEAPISRPGVSFQTDAAVAAPLARNRAPLPPPSAKPQAPIETGQDEAEEPDLRGTCWPFPVGKSGKSPKRIAQAQSIRTVTPATARVTSKPQATVQPQTSMDPNREDREGRSLMNAAQRPAPLALRADAMQAELSSLEDAVPLSPTALIIDNMADSDIMQHLIRAASDDDISAIARLCKYDRAKLLLNSTNHNGVGPLHVAGYHGNLGVLKALLRYGANPFFKSEEGMTAEDYAEQRSKNDVRAFYFSLKDKENFSVHQPIHIGASSALNKLRGNSAKSISMETSMPRALESSSTVANPYQPGTAADATRADMTRGQMTPTVLNARPTTRPWSQQDVMVSSVAQSAPRASEPASVLAPLTRPPTGQLRKHHGMILTT